MFPAPLCSWFWLILLHSILYCAVVVVNRCFPQPILLPPGPWMLIVRRFRGFRIDACLSQPSREASCERLQIRGVVKIDAGLTRPSNSATYSSTALSFIDSSLIFFSACSCLAQSMTDCRKSDSRMPQATESVGSCVLPLPTLSSQIK